MKKGNLCKLALLSLSAFLVFGCQAKGDDTMEVTRQEMIEYYNNLSADEQLQFDQMTEQEKKEAIQAAKQKQKSGVKIEKSRYDSYEINETQKKAKPKPIAPKKKPIAPPSNN